MTNVAAGAAIILALTLGADSSPSTLPRASADESPYPCSSCLFSIGADGRGERIVRREPPPILDLSPDRRQLLYTRYPCGGSTCKGEGLFVEPIRGGAEVRIGPHAGGRAVFSPDGKTVAYVRGFEVPPDPGPPCFGTEIWLARTDGSGAGSFPICGSLPSWAPDSRHLAFATDVGSGSAILAVASVDGSDRHDLGIVERELGYGFLPPRWSARGLIAYATPSEARPPSGAGGSDGGPSFNGTDAVHVVRPDGSVVRTLDRATLPSWSPDGGRLAYVQEGRERDALRIAAPDGGRAREVLPHWCCFGLSGPAGAHWSPDGRLLAYAIEDQIYVVRSDGAGRRRVTHSKPGGWIDALWWAPDSSRLYYAWTLRESH